MNDMAPIGYAVTVILPDRYFQASLYIEVPGDTPAPDAVARDLAAKVTRRLAAEVPAALLRVTQVRRLG